MPETRRYHIVGVGGVGMSALTQVLLAQGHRVTGSDRAGDAGTASDALATLQRAGLELRPQDGTGVAADTTAVVVSTAIEDDNPDILAARRLNVPIVHRADMLARLARGHRLVAVTGTAGKTTVTGMIGWVLEQLGEDPTVVNGGAVLGWVDERRVGNARIGRSDLWVLEVDESDRSLLRFEPDWAVITNISKDHFELAEVEALFAAFARQVRREIVGCLGRPADADALRHFTPELNSAGCRFAYRGVTFDVPQIGRHNAENALHCVLLCERLGLDLRRVSAALATFPGIQRRLERVGEARGIAVLDDYAHNPVKIRAAWRAVAPDHQRVLGIWRPHGFGPLALMRTELTEMFAEVARPTDRVFILPVFYAGGTAQRAVTSETFVDGLRARQAPAECVADYAALEERLLREARAGDVILWMGARDPQLPVAARRLVGRLQKL